MFVPIAELHQSTNIGTGFSFGFQGNITSRFWVRIHNELSNSTSQDTRLLDIPDNNLFDIKSLKGDFRANTWQLSGVYYFGKNNNLKPKKLFFYSVFGVGFSTISVPFWSYNTQNKILDISSRKQSFFAYNMSLGAEYRFNNNMILYLETSLYSIPQNTILTFEDLSYISFALGTRMPLF